MSNAAELSVALVGVDGGSWNVISWLLQDNYMPNLKRLVTHGISSNLRSLIPPVTGGAWLSLATGLNPGKTGVVDFYKHVGNWTLEPVSSTDYRDRSLWDYCSICGLKVAVLDYPMLFPAYAINGIMISSWGGRVTTHPPELINEIERIVGGSYDIFVDYHLEKYNDIELFLEDLSKAVEKKLRVSRYFMRRKWNLFIDVISYTDWLQHRMWHYIDPTHPLYPGDQEASRYKRKFAEFWQILDEYIGEVVETYDITLIVSDHGFGPQWGVFNFGKWAVEYGYASAQKSFIKGIIKSLLKLFAKLKLDRVLPSSFREKLRRHGLVLSAPSLIFNLEKSKIIILDYSIAAGLVHVNVKHVDDVDKFIEMLIKDLSAYLEKVNSNLRLKFWKAKDLYHGDKVNCLPDLIFTINDWSCVVIKDLDKKFVYFEGPYSPRYTGSHRLYGIFIAYGNGISKGKHLAEVSILDIAPTVLHIFGLPIPDNMDGRVLTEIFEPHSVFAKRELRYVNPAYYMKLKLTAKIKQIRETKLTHR